MHHRKRGASKRDQTRHAPEEDPEFQIAPMIDILLVLLVFFMSISSTEVLQSNQEISLAVAKDARQPKPNPGQVVLNVSWQTLSNIGSVEVNSRSFDNPADLVGILREAIMRTPQTRVLIRSDRSVRYEYERRILKAIGDAGISNVTFSVVDKDIPSAAPANPAK